MHKAQAPTCTPGLEDDVRPLSLNRADASSPAGRERLCAGPPPAWLNPALLDVSQASANNIALPFVLSSATAARTMGDERENDEHEAMVRAIAAGEISALERLYRELRAPVFAVALSLVRDYSTAEDVLHDTFVRVWEKADSYRPGTRPRSWVLGIARNLAIDGVRRRARQPPLEDVRAVVEDDRLEPFAYTSALMTLEPLERQIVVLRVVAGLTHAEIAAQVELPPGTVRWRYRLALGRLKPLVSEESDV
jgi:RNA polymerase sigma-70 factor (ECF subfamily)